jgi:hypothetical protein
MNTYKLRNKGGFIAVVTLMFLVLFSIFGFMYWFSSKSSAELIMYESDRIKARNYALAAVERVKVHLFNEYSRGEIKPIYHKGGNKALDGEYNRKIDDGEYNVIQVKPLGEAGSEWYGRPHICFGGGVIGYYDLWEIITEGRVNKSGIKAEAKVVIKIYRDNIVQK